MPPHQRHQQQSAWQTRSTQQPSTRAAAASTTSQAASSASSAAAFSNAQPSSKVSSHRWNNVIRFESKVPLAALTTLEAVAPPPPTNAYRGGRHHQQQQHNAVMAQQPPTQDQSKDSIDSPTVKFVCNVSVSLKDAGLATLDIARLIRTMEDQFSNRESGGGPPDTVYFVSLDVSGNNLTCDAIQQVSNWFCSNNRYVRLRNLKVYKNAVSDDGALALASLVFGQVSPLEELHLSHNEISAVGASALFKAFAEAKKTSSHSSSSSSSSSSLSTASSSSAVASQGAAGLSSSSRLRGSSSQFVYPRYDPVRGVQLPVWIRLEYNNIVDTTALLQRWEKETKSIRGITGSGCWLTCFADRPNQPHGNKDPHCSPARCVCSGPTHSPILHLYSFHHQLSTPPTANPTTTAVASSPTPSPVEVSPVTVGSHATDPSPPSSHSRPSHPTVNVTGRTHRQVGHKQQHNATDTQQQQNAVGGSGSTNAASTSVTQSAVEQKAVRQKRLSSRGDGREPLADDSVLDPPKSSKLKGDRGGGAWSQSAIHQDGPTAESSGLTKNAPPATYKAVGPSVASGRIGTQRAIKEERRTDTRIDTRTDTASDTASHHPQVLILAPVQPPGVEASVHDQSQQPQRETHTRSQPPVSEATTSPTAWMESKATNVRLSDPAVVEARRLPPIVHSLPSSQMALAPLQNPTGSVSITTTGPNAGTTDVASSCHPSNDSGHTLHGPGTVPSSSASAGKVEATTRESPILSNRHPSQEQYPQAINGSKTNYRRIPEVATATDGRPIMSRQPDELFYPNAMQQRPSAPSANGLVQHSSMTHFPPPGSLHYCHPYQRIPLVGSSSSHPVRGGEQQQSASKFQLFIDSLSGTKDQEQNQHHREFFDLQASSTQQHQAAPPVGSYPFPHPPPSRQDCYASSYGYFEERMETGADVTRRRRPLAVDYPAYPTAADLKDGRGGATQTSSEQQPQQQPVQPHPAPSASLPVGAPKNGGSQSQQQHPNMLHKTPFRSSAPPLTAAVTVPATSAVTAPAVGPSSATTLPLYIFLDASAFSDMRLVQKKDRWNLFSFPALYALCRKKAFCHSTLVTPIMRYNQEGEEVESLDASQSVILMAISSMVEGLVSLTEDKPFLRDALIDLRDDFIGPLMDYGVIENLDDHHAQSHQHQPERWLFSHVDLQKASSLGVSFASLKILDFALVWAHHVSKITPPASSSKPLHVEGDYPDLSSCAVFLTSNPKVEQFFAYLAKRHSTWTQETAASISSQFNTGTSSGSANPHANNHHEQQPPTTSGSSPSPCHLVCVHLDQLNQLLREQCPSLTRILEGPDWFEPSTNPPPSTSHHPGSSGGGNIQPTEVLSANTMKRVLLSQRKPLLTIDASQLGIPQRQQPPPPPPQHQQQQLPTAEGRDENRRQNDSTRVVLPPNLPPKKVPLQMWPAAYTNSSESQLPEMECEEMLVHLKASLEAVHQENHALRNELSRASGIVAELFRGVKATLRETDRLSATSTAASLGLGQSSGLVPSSGLGQSSGQQQQQQQQQQQYQTVVSESHQQQQQPLHDLSSLVMQTEDDLECWDSLLLGAPGSVVGTIRDHRRVPNTVANTVTNTVTNTVDPLAHPAHPTSSSSSSSSSYRPLLQQHQRQHYPSSPSSAARMQEDPVGGTVRQTQQSSSDTTSSSVSHHHHPPQHPSNQPPPQPSAASLSSYPPSSGGPMMNHRQQHRGYAMANEVREQSQQAQQHQPSSHPQYHQGRPNSVDAFFDQFSNYKQ